MDLETNDRKNLLAVNLGLGANALLAVLKTSVGIVGHSQALLADGIMSTSDVVYLVIVRIFFGLADKPPDREHPFGHRQLESIAAVIVGAFVVTTAVAIFWNAVNQVYELLTGQKEAVGAGSLALWVALFTVVVKIWLSVFTRRIAEQTKSVAVLALARDHRNDIFSITTAAVGIFFSWEGYVWVDPMAAALVALVILYTGIEILRDSSADLLDILPDRRVTNRVRQLVEVVPGVEHVEDVRVHRIGHYLMADVTIGIDGTMSVAEGDEVASKVEQTLGSNVEYLHHVSVHYHPSKRRWVG